MLTKVLTAIVLTGALWVAGDAAYQKFGCPLQALGLCPLQRGCCSSETPAKTDGCCPSSSECCKQAPECCVE